MISWLTRTSSKTNPSNQPPGLKLEILIDRVDSKILRFCENTHNAELFQLLNQLHFLIQMIFGSNLCIQLFHMVATLN